MLQQTKPKHVCGGKKVMYIRTIYIAPAVVASAAEAEYAALFMAVRDAVDIRNILSDLGYHQPLTSLLCDNACALGLATNIVRQHQLKSIDMRFHWIGDRIQEHQFQVHWRKEALNLADFFTKILPVTVHKATMPLLIKSGLSPTTLLKKISLRT